MAQIRKQSMKEQIYQIIKDRILNLEYPMDTPLNLVQLSKELGTSNTPLREALSLLEAEGLVVASLNNKVRVIGFTQESYRDLKLNLQEHQHILDAVRKNDVFLVQKLLHQHYDKHLTEESLRHFS